MKKEREREREKVERIEEEVKTGGRRDCRHGGLFDPLSLFPPDLSHGHAYRVFFNREIHHPRHLPCLATITTLSIDRSFVPTSSRSRRKNEKPEVERAASGSNVVGTRSRGFRLSARRFVQSFTRARERCFVTSRWPLSKIGRRHDRFLQYRGAMEGGKFFFLHVQDRDSEIDLKIKDFFFFVVGIIIWDRVSVGNVSF